MVKILACLVVTMTGAVAAALPSITVPETKLAPLLTAQPDDPAWNAAKPVLLDQASLGTPAALVPNPPPKTEVRLLWDVNNLYVRFTCAEETAPYFPPPDSPDAHHIYAGDAAEFFLDPVGDSRQWFEFQFNARNDRFAQITVCTAEPKSDASLRLLPDFIAHDVWAYPMPNPEQVRSAASWLPGAKTWIVDAAFPAAMLLKRTGLKKFVPMQLRGNLIRYQWIEPAPGAKRELLSLNWSPIPRYVPHRCPAAFGFIKLTGVASSSTP
jgi:hypothetical protein